MDVVPFSIPPIFTIFTKMKKYSLTIFLLILFAAAFAKNGEAFIQQAKQATALQSGLGINPGTNHIVPDIELASPGTWSSAQLTHSLQKTTVYLFVSAKTKDIFIAVAIPGPDFSQILSPEKRYLSHNYPSHNFW